MNKKETMKRFYTALVSIILIFCLTSSAWAVNSFIVQRISVVGNRGLSKSTVLNYMPISVGDEYTQAKSAEILKALFESGFFTNVNLARQGNTLIVKVTERPTIASVKVTGNEGIKKDELKKILKQEGLTTGSVYNRAVLSNFKEALQTEYFALGYYAAKVNTNVQNLPRSRVAININITAGSVAKVASINFVGNNAFSSSKLRDQMLITTPKLWSFITKGDQYSKAKLDASLEKIQSFYMDNGYIHAKVVSSNAALSPNHEKVNITIHIYEGGQYHFSGYKFAGRTIVPVSKLNSLVTFEKGETFSRQKIQETNQAIAFALGDDGYAFAKIVPTPSVNERTKAVFITFHIIPGTQVYVRRILFKGNTITGGYVLRRNMQQMEGSLLSSRKVQQSVRKLRLLGFFKNVSVQTVPVPGKNNQADLVYHVTPTPAGQAMVSLGYGTLGWELGAGISQPNFLGTGRTVGAHFSHSSYATSYTINYYNPYYTVNNIGRGISLFYTTTNPDGLNLSSNYAFDTYGFNVDYHIPITLNNSVTAGFGLSRIDLRTFPCARGTKNCTPISNELNAFTEAYGTDYIQPTINLGWSYVGLDKAIFPTEGASMSVSGVASVPLFSKTLRSYKIATTDEYYLPLNRSHSFVLHFRGTVGYGNGYGSTKGLPFFMNYYAGGLAQGLVRGYETNTLGPLDSNRNSIGGNFLAAGTVSLIFPNLISPDNLRTSVFFDAGNVYQTNSSLYTTGSGALGMSAGLAVQWRSPVGPLEFSFAKVFEKKRNVDGSLSEPFQFTMGTSF